MPDGIQEGDSSHENMVSSKIRVVDQSHPVQLAIDANNLLACLSNVQIDMILLVTLIDIRKGRTGDIVSRSEFSGQLGRHSQTLLVKQDDGLPVI